MTESLLCRSGWTCVCLQFPVTCHVSCFHSLSMPVVIFCVFVAASICIYSPLLRSFSQSVNANTYISSHSTTSACPVASFFWPPGLLRDPCRRPFEEPAADPGATKRHPGVRQRPSRWQPTFRAAVAHPRWNGEEKGASADRRSPQPVGDGDDGGGGALRGQRRRERLRRCGVEMAQCHGPVDGVLRAVQSDRLRQAGSRSQDNQIFHDCGEVGPRVAVDPTPCWDGGLCHWSFLFSFSFFFFFFAPSFLRSVQKIPRFKRFSRADLF